MNIRLSIAYDGTHYCGWQKTVTGLSIEETIQNILEKVLQEPIVLQAASRTDAGVHADHQVINFNISKNSVDLGHLRHSLLCLLPRDISLLDIEPTSPHFHPTLDCIAKEYRYSLCYGTIQLPKERLYAWHYPYPLEIDLMQQAAHMLVGTHDFGAFCNLRTSTYYETKVRTIDQIQVLPFEGKRLEIHVKGNHFLYKMVRNLVGTLVHIGQRRISLVDLEKILLSKDRKQAGVTAPAHGLSLYKLYY